MKEGNQNHGMSEDDIRKRNDIITRLNKKSIPLLLSLMSKHGMYENDMEQRYEVIQSFYADKLCGKSPEQLQHFENKWPGLIWKSFKNYVIDLMRKKNSEKRKTEKYTIQQTRVPSNSHLNYDEGEKTLEQCRRILRKKHNRRYVMIFTMMTQGYDNKEIAEALGGTPNAINVAIHRMRETLNKTELFTHL